MNNYKNTILCFILVFSIFILSSCLNSSGEDDELANYDYNPKDIIIGVEPGSGLYNLSKKAIEGYGIEQEMSSGSSAVMTQLLGDAIAKKEPIAVTAWSPHWIFKKYDLKFLEDPKGSYGPPEEIRTFVRDGFKDYSSGAYEILDNFYWTPDEMQDVLADVNNGGDVNKITEEWLENHPDRYEKWTDGVPDGNGQIITLAYVFWDSEYAASHLVSKALEKKGYETRMIAVELGAMFAAVSYGDADATVCAWLPSTHNEFLEDYGDTMIDLGPNLHGTRNGIVVPSYMDIKTIEDLKNYK